MSEFSIARPPRPALALRSALAAALLVVTPGCALLGVQEQREALQRFALIRGEARVDIPSPHPVVVVLLRRSESANDGDPLTGPVEETVTDHFPLAGPGAFAFAVAPGTFRLAAFVDENRDGNYDPGEPALISELTFSLGPGERRDDIELVIRHDVSLDRHHDIREMQAREPRDQQHFSLGRFTARGDVVDLGDPKFGPASGELGMWRFVDFLFEIGPGIYFLEEYDPAKIPVLFVHGMSGYPQQFATLIAGLDRDRFQPWFYFYPSGVHLDGIANHLTDSIAKLQVQHEFEAMAVVAHSMGGLVARAFIQRSEDLAPRHQIELFVSISAPWGGSEAAIGVENAPERLMVFSWLDMSPQSDFLAQLFHESGEPLRPRRLPHETHFHMIFGFRRNERSPGPSSDGVVSVRSQARREAVEAARSILPLDDDHTGILHSDEVQRRLEALLLQRFEERLGLLGSH